ncbi:transglutaminase domain-containing protein [Candidatus Woesearchaeota archaeon]|nr:transglutaminase domain-containing protein [Candidatus Woesearchaeota archaeon]
MTERFAFGLSITDWIRKLGSGYENPIDFLDNFIRRFYASKSEVDITLTDKKVGITSPATLDDIIFEGAKDGNIQALAIVLPPIEAYSHILLESGKYTLEVGRDRVVKVKQRDDFKRGTRLVIARRGRRGGSYYDVRRLIKLYQNTDANIRLNGHDLKMQRGAFDFRAGDFRGSMFYDPSEQGQIYFFQDGRHISDIEFLKGITLNLYEHGLPVTTTKSRVMTTGKGKKQFDAFQRELPSIVVDFLHSEYVRTIRQESETSYQTILRSVFYGFKNNKEICDIIAENILFADHTGDINLKYSLNRIESDVGISLPQSELKLYTDITGKSRENVMAAHTKTKTRTTYLKHMAIASLTAFLLSTGFALRSTPPHEATQQTTAIDGTHDVQESRSLQELKNYSLGGTRMFQNSTALPFGITVLESGSIPESIVSGGDYLSRDDLARMLASRSHNPRDAGYIRYDTSNHLFEQSGGLFWDDKEPYSKLISSIRISLPEKLSTLRGESDKKKIAKIMEYINKTFRYDSIDPEVGEKYGSMLEAMLAEKKAICTTGNTYAALLLYKLGVDNVRYASGLHDGIPHTWLEIEENGDWKIADFTPKKLSDEFYKKLKEYGGMPSAGRIAPIKNLSDIISMFRNHIERDSTPISLADMGKLLVDEANFMVTNPVEYLGASATQAGILGIALSFLALLGVGTYAGISKLKNMTPYNNPKIMKVPDINPTLIQLSDILGTRVLLTDKGGPHYSNNEVYIPHMMLNRGALEIAAKVVPMLPREQQLNVYKTIAHVAK